MNSLVRVCVAAFLATLLFCSSYSAPVVSSAKKEAKKTEEKKSVPILSAEKELENIAAAQKQSDTSLPKELKISETPDFIKQAIEKAKLSESPASQDDAVMQEEDNTEQLQKLLNEVQNNFDVSPKTVAKYLLIDDDFDGFNAALDELTNSGVLSPSEVARFREEVSWHYDNLLKNLLQSQDALPQENEYAPYAEYPMDNGLEYDSYRPRALDDYDRALARMRLQGYMEKQASLDSLLRQLIADYYSRYGVDETYENYDPYEGLGYDDTQANEYDMPMDMATAEQNAEAEALEEQAEQRLTAPVKKSAAKKEADKKSDNKKAEKKAEKKTVKKEEKKRA